MYRVISMLLLTVGIFSPNSFADVQNGKICTYGSKPLTHPQKVCRDPIDPSELQKERAKDNYYACKFSLLSTWSGEIGKIQKELAALRGLRQIDSQELYWAQQDINKQAFLPSETVRAAYESAAYFGRAVASENAQINTQEWCLRCAMKRNNGADDCD